LRDIFTRTTLASIGISCRRASVCLSIRPSVTSLCSTETAKQDHITSGTW